MPIELTETHGNERHRIRLTDVEEDDAFDESSGDDPSDDDDDIDRGSDYEH